VSPDADLSEMAQDELARAVTLSWRDLSRVVPWGDTYEGVSPAGRFVKVETSYIWARDEGGDILCEVAVFPNDVLYDQGARRSVVIPRDQA
jgi:hypothetical protein